jgi:hypothetical protein
MSCGSGSMNTKSTSMGNIVPFKPPETFKRLGIDWTRAAASQRERTLREAFLTYETSCGPDGLVAVLLLATVGRRQRSIADDLDAASKFAEVVLAMKLRKHQDDAITAMDAHVKTKGNVWS